MGWLPTNDELRDEADNYNGLKFSFKASKPHHFQ